MEFVTIEAGPFRFQARFERDAAPQTCRRFARLLPFANKIVHARWSGEAVFIPLGNFEMKLGAENATSHPTPGQILLYPGGVSETEVLFAYGSSHFASKAGPLAGNHFLTITRGMTHLREFGEHVLWKGAQDIVFRAA
jgi:hypothetical protein